MTLEDFEKSLAEEKKAEESAKSKHQHDDSRKHRSHHRHHHDDDNGHKRKRRRYSGDRSHRHRTSHKRQDIKSEEIHESNHGVSESNNLARVAGHLPDLKDEDGARPSSATELQRDSWMEAPNSFDIEYTQRSAQKPPDSAKSRSSKADFQLKIHDNELNKHHLEDLAEGRELLKSLVNTDSKHEVDYTFGDAGAKWRMTKLRAVYRKAEESGKSIDDVAEEQYGDMRAFDDAREEQTELERRDTYGDGYVGKEKPSGELFEERKLATGIRRRRSSSDGAEKHMEAAPTVLGTERPDVMTVPMDQTALNRLKAQMLKAKVRGAENAASLEAEYNSAMASFANQTQPGVIVLGAMDNRMLTGSRKGEVVDIENRRGRERGLVEENEDMTIEDMVKQERRTRHQAGGDGQRFAERIAKDAKFDNDLDYMDDNANKLAKRVQKSEINLKNTAVSEFQKMNRILDNCPLCHHEDTETPPVAPVVSLATRVFLTLPTEPEISEGGASIVPIQHRNNLLQCDDDEWEEIRVCLSVEK